MPEYEATVKITTDEELDSDSLKTFHEVLLYALAGISKRDEDVAFVGLTNFRRED